MAAFQDFPPPSPNPADIYNRIAQLLVGAYSVEVIPSGNTVILRVWLQRHCDPSTHQPV
jgi:hypothetical protein